MKDPNDEILRHFYRSRSHLSTKEFVIRWLDVRGDANGAAARDRVHESERSGKFGAPRRSSKTACGGRRKSSFRSAHVPGRRRPARVSGEPRLSTGSTIPPAGNAGVEALKRNQRLRPVSGWPGYPRRPPWPFRLRPWRHLGWAWRRPVPCSGSSERRSRPT